jgi:hypothetical protein
MTRRISTSTFHGTNVPKILEWVFVRYGAKQAAMVANQNTLAPRAAMREIAKVYGLPAAEIGKALDLLHRRADFVNVTEGSTLQTWGKRSLSRPAIAPTLAGHSLPGRTTAGTLPPSQPPPRRSGLGSR